MGRTEGRSCQDNYCSPMTTPAGGKKIIIIAHVLNAAESTPDTVQTKHSRSLRKVPCPHLTQKTVVPRCHGISRTSSTTRAIHEQQPVPTPSRQPKAPSNTLKPCGWICESGLVRGSGLPWFHLGPRQVLGLPGWQWLHPRCRCSGPHLSAFYPQRFGCGEQARAAASARAPTARSDHQTEEGRGRGKEIAVSF